MLTVAQAKSNLAAIWFLWKSAVEAPQAVMLKHC
jgi:hypothetical protein